jgi:sigma-B regulation protein RsbU (phosphoserine phosphatase)
MAATAGGHTVGMGLNTGPVLDSLPQAMANDLVRLLKVAAEPLGASEISVYLADFQGLVLQPVQLDLDLSVPVLAEEDVGSSMAGRAFATGQPVTVERDDGVRVWVPLVERGERTGVVALTVDRVDDEVLADCVRLGLFAGLLVRAFARTTDLFHLRRRGQPMTLAAGMQWDLLPPLAVRSAEVLAAGRLEPAYEIAGDAFDYALNGRVLDAALFDGMGHGVESTLMTTLAMGAYRHARRANEPPGVAYAAIDDAVASQYQGEAFVTAVLVRLSLDDGSMEWANAGHPPPLLLRDKRVARALECSPSLPLGLGGECRQVAVESLEPGDVVLFFTDGVIEGRSPEGDEFGTDRLARMWEQEWSSGRPPEEVLRRVVQAVSAFTHGPLRDDATLLQLCWYGPSKRP